MGAACPIPTAPGAANASNTTTMRTVALGIMPSPTSGLFRADAFEEADERTVERVGLLQDDRVAAGDQAQAGTPDQLGQRAREVGRGQDVVLAADDERGDLDRAQAPDPR